MLRASGTNRLASLPAQALHLAFHRQSLRMEYMRMTLSEQYHSIKKQQHLEPQRHAVQGPAAVLRPEQASGRRRE